MSSSQPQYDINTELTVTGGQNRLVVKLPHCNHKDVGSNPTATRNGKRTLGDLPREGGPMVWTGSQWKTSHVKLN